MMRGAESRRGCWFWGKRRRPRVDADLVRADTLKDFLVSFVAVPAWIRVNPWPLRFFFRFRGIGLRRAPFVPRQAGLELSRARANRNSGRGSTRVDADLIRADTPKRFSCFVRCGFRVDPRKPVAIDCRWFSRGVSCGSLALRSSRHGPRSASLGARCASPLVR